MCAMEGGRSEPRQHRQHESVQNQARKLEAGQPAQLIRKEQGPPNQRWVSGRGRSNRNGKGSRGPHAITLVATLNEAVSTHDEVRTTISISSTTAWLYYKYYFKL